MKAYLEISVEKELPKEHGKQLCSQRKDMFIAAHFNKDTKEWRNGSFKKYPKVWLRELSLPELMEEYISYCKDLTAVEFLTQKGIL